MAKRKRASRKQGNEASSKRTKVNGNNTDPNSLHQIEHPVLRQYYPLVLTLRQFIRAQLLSTSKRRLRVLDNLQDELSTQQKPERRSSSTSSPARFNECRSILDSILVGQCKPLEQPRAEAETTRLREYETFSQQLGTSGSAVKSQLGSQHVTLSEIIDFSIWLIFNRRYPNHNRPPHVLCHGFVRASVTWQHRETGFPCGIPGLIQVYENEHVKRLKGSAWKSLFTLLGGSADRIMIHLLTSCGLFVPVQTSASCYYQTSGHLLSDTKVLSAQKANPIPGGDCIAQRLHTGGVRGTQTALHKPSDIRFVRSRMLYARAALNTKGEVSFGLRHIHVLNRYPDCTNPLHTARVMMYMFPRQFGLHNVFTSKTDPKDTAQQFQDYTLREREIAKQGLMQRVKAPGKSSRLHGHSYPKRLRGYIPTLIQTLQKKHAKCSYTKLLAHYCPLPGAASRTTISRRQPTMSSTEHVSFKELATPAAQVSAFCRATFRRIFPVSLFGGPENMKTIHRHMDCFIKNRRFESPVLSSIMVGLKIKGIEWLRPPSCATTHNISLTDYTKRLEILAELVYYVFDSFLIPLVRSNFHVTETSTDRNRLYYFRQDVWRRLTEPVLHSLKASMFDEVGSETSLNSIQKRTLGHAQLRLLPKENGVRPISNLRRRPVVKSNGTSVLGRSINSALGPAFHVLNFEKTAQPDRLGSSLFSVAGVYQRLAHYRDRVVQTATVEPKFFFVKVDVKGCFDSIPQKQLTLLMQQLLSTDEYSVAQIAEVRRCEIAKGGEKWGNNNPIKRFSAIAHDRSDNKTFDDLLVQRHGNKPDRPNTIYVDSAMPQRISKTQVTKLFSEHINCNIAKIGKKYFRQNRGIAQGSVVSSLLCNFFYGDLEQHQLAFLKDTESVLLRLIDDFLLITTNKEKALKFLQIMHSGIPSYGVEVKPDKTVVNFEARIEGISIPRLSKYASGFPYCGMLVDCRTLEVRKDVANCRMGRVADTLTVEYGRHPGRAFHRKMLAALQLQMHTMLLDTAHNSRLTVLENVFLNMIEISIKSYEYVKCLGKRQQLSPLTLKNLIEDLCGLAFAMMKNSRNKLRRPGYQCSVGKSVTRWLTLKAFLCTFMSKHSRFDPILTWLKTNLTLVEKRCGHEIAQLEAVAQKSWKRRSQGSLDEIRAHR